ncbi:MAG: hypothetical protein ACR2OW_04605 [Methyloligellaceae bacterium]
MTISSNTEMSGSHLRAFACSPEASQSNSSQHGCDAGAVGPSLFGVLDGAGIFAHIISHLTNAN